MEKVEFELNAIFGVFIGSTCEVLEMLYTLRQSDNPESIITKFDTINNVIEGIN
jgi:hypothetical protein